ncbi:MAG: hypothetical protein ABI586_03380 [Candidatus Nanopelagicales bacterium]
MHWGTALLAAVVSVIWLGIDVTAWASLSKLPLLLLATLSIQVGLAVSATVFSIQAVRRNSNYAETDRWDHLTSIGAVAAAAVGTTVLGGAASPLWFVVLVSMTYLALLTVGNSGNVVAICLALAVAGSATFNQQWDLADRAKTTAVLIGLPFAFLVSKYLAHHLFTATENVGWEREVLGARVMELSGLLQRAAGGDLSVAGGLVAVVDGDRFGDDHLLLLARSFDETLGSLRGLVGLNRPGFDS